MTLVILGWDGLDPGLVEKHADDSAFGTYGGAIETVVNETLDKPHTYECWPSMFTGRSPTQHGVHAEAYTEGGAWDSWLLNALTVASRPIPDSLRKRIGGMIRDRGASIHHHTLETYEDTVFDGYDSVAIALPNGRSSTDNHLGIESDRGGQLSSYLQQATGQEGVRESAVPQCVLLQRLQAEMSHKLGAVSASLAFDPDIVWVWLGYLDTIGHVAPTVGDRERWLRDAYTHAARSTATIRTQLDTDDQLWCVSDHGLKDGQHTNEAYFGADTPEPAENVAHILHLRQAIENHISTKKSSSDPYSGAQSTAKTKERLADLGYL